MLHFRRVALGFAALSVLSIVSVADAALTKVDGAKVVFHAQGTGMKFDGTTNDMWSKDDGKVVRIYVPLKNLDTGMSLRNTHMKEKYLEVDKFPEAEFAMRRVDLKLPEDGKSTEGDVTGTFKLHGVAKSRPVHYKATRSGTKYTVEASVAVDMNEHDVKVPSYLGVTVKKDVTVDATFSISDI